MKPPFDSLPNRRAGSVLILGLAVSVALLLTLAAAVSTTVSMGKNINWEMDRTAALALADGVTESAQKKLLGQISDFRTPDRVGQVLVGGKWYTYDANPIGASNARVDADGVTNTVQPWRISATVTAGDGQVTVERVIDLTLTPLFQYMIFYAGDLELLPGPSMTLGGRVHANGDIYVGSNSTLTVDTEWFQCTGGIYRRRKNDGTATAGIVDVKVRGTPGYQQLTAAQDSEYGDWTLYALDRWKGTVQDSSHGVKEIAAPSIGTIRAFNHDGSKGYYHQSADLVIVDGRAFDSAGLPIDVPGLVVEKTMYDAREGKNVTVSELDVQKLNTSGHFPANGLIYAYRTDASVTQPNGFRLANGSQIAAPLTFVSEDPVYVRGDFNTVAKKGVSVISDAVNLLSNSWSDSGGTMQKATATTYNLAMVTGNVPTPDGGGTYSGGFENLPRFHESWKGVKATIRGSFLNLFESRIARAPWGKPRVYSPPNRDWRFDPALAGTASLPPFTPNAVRFQRVLWDDRTPLPFAVP